MPAIERATEPDFGARTARFATVHSLEHRLASMLRTRTNRIIFGIGLGAFGLLLKLVLNAISGEDTGFVAYYLLVAASAAAGGASAGLATTAMVALGQAVFFYEPLGSVLIADTGNLLRLGLFTVSGFFVSFITNGLIGARARAEAAGDELERLYDAEAAARRHAEDAARRTQILFETSASLSEALTPEQVAAVVIRQGVVELGAVGGAVHAVASDGSALELVRADGYPAEVVATYRHVPIDKETAIGAVAATGKPIFLVDRAEIQERFPASLVRARVDGEQAFAGLPMVIENHTVGVVSLGFATPQTFGEAERAFHETLVQQIAQAFERARLFASERDAREIAERAETAADASRSGLEFLAEAGRVLGTSLDFESTIQQVAGLAVRFLADWCTIEVIADDGRITSVGLAHRDPALVATLRDYRERYRPDQYHLGPSKVMATGIPEHVPAQTEEQIQAHNPTGDLADQLRRLGTRSYLCVGIPGGDGQVLGTVTMGSREPGRLDDRALELALELGRRVGTAMEHARLYAEARQLVATVDASLDAVFMFEPTDLRFTYVNQGAMNQVGFTREQLLGMSALEIKPDFDEAGYRELMAPLLTGERPAITFSTSHLHRDGTRIPVEVLLQAVRLPGEKVQMIVTARDIRQQIEVEANLYRLARAERARAAELSAVIRGIGDGVLVCDAGGRVILANPAAAAILGTSVERYDDIVALLDDADRLPALASQGGPVELRLHSADRWIDVSTYPVSLDTAELYADPETTIIVVRDITAARRARAAREAFIGVMSHELRTPITTIYGTTKLFNRAADSPELMRTMLADVEAEADRLYRLVEDLLILSRSESGLEVEGEPVLLQHVVRSVMAGEATRWPETRFTTVVPAGLPPVIGDRTHLEQVVRNLLSNAAKYSPPGTQVEVRGQIEGGEVAVRVLDSGPGIAEQEAQHLFELFYRSPTTARKVSGAGIGLYVSRALIEAMGGQIWAKPRPEGGAEFGFSVPILVAESEIDEFDEPSITPD